MSANIRAGLGRLVSFVPLVVALAWGAQLGLAQAPTGKITWDQGKSVYNRRIHPPEAPSKVDWNGRITALLKEEPGDVILNAVGDMIFDQKISDLPDPDRQGLFRIMQEADIAYGNLEFSINEHPELQRPFYNFRTGREFAWEVAAIGINMVSLANNHTQDFGPEGLEDSLKALDLTSITHAGAGLTLAAAHAPGTSGGRVPMTPARDSRRAAATRGTRTGAVPTPEVMP